MRIPTLRAGLATTAAVAAAVAGLAQLAQQREAGALLKKARKQENAMLKQVAEVLGVSIFRVCTIEDGGNLTPQVFERFLAAVDAGASHFAICSGVASLSSNARGNWTLRVRLETSTMTCSAGCHAHGSREMSSSCFAIAARVDAAGACCRYLRRRGRRVSASRWTPPRSRIKHGKYTDPMRSPVDITMTSHGYRSA